MLNKWDNDYEMKCKLLEDEAKAKFVAMKLSAHMPNYKELRAKREQEFHKIVTMLFDLNEIKYKVMDAITAQDFAFMVEKVRRYGINNKYNS